MIGGWFCAEGADGGGSRRGFSGEIQIAAPLYINTTMKNINAPRHHIHFSGASMTHEFPSAINKVIPAAMIRRNNSQLPFNLPALSSTTTRIPRMMPRIPIASENETLVTALTSIQTMG
jgi:hypothetical protein